MNTVRCSRCQWWAYSAGCEGGPIVALQAHWEAVHGGVPVVVVQP